MPRTIRSVETVTITIDGDSEPCLCVRPELATATYDAAGNRRELLMLDQRTIEDVMSSYPLTWPPYHWQFQLHSYVAASGPGGEE